MANGDHQSLSSAFDDMLEVNWRELEGLYSGSQTPAVTRDMPTASPQSPSRTLSQFTRPASGTSDAERFLNDRYGDGWKQEILEQKRDGDEVVIRVEDDGSIVMGITDYAQDAMGDLVFIELPGASDESIAREEAFAVVESVKAVQDVYAPLTGRVTEVNDELPNTPEVLNQDPYGDGWMVRMEIENTSELEELMDVAAYEEMVGDLS